MKTVTAHTAEGASRSVSLDSRAPLLAALQAAGFSIPAVCGGRGKCGKCKVRLLSDGWRPTVADTAFFSQAEIAAGWRLSCAALSRMFPDTPPVIEIPDGESSMVAVDDFDWGAIPVAADSTGDNGEPYGIAIDIGTTTIALRLVNRRTGRAAGRWTAVNRQREWGADVISRIQKANRDGLTLLTRSVRAQVSEGIAALCAGAAIAPASVGKIAVAANTTMIHLLLGLSCATLGVAPFTPVTLGPVVMPCRVLFDVECAAEITVLPGISTYVGADIAAGIFFSGMSRRPEPSLLLDIGTNGEIALHTDGALIVAATAAGPAFEGGNIRWGTGSVPGAISGAWYRDGVWTVTTIEDRPPVGICGSGLVSAVWECARHGLIEPGGRFNPDHAPDGTVTLARTVCGEDITLTQKDIRELQLAKSAVCSGVEALLRYAGLAAADVKTLYIAGGFGRNIDYAGAAGIGLIPHALRDKISLIGNSALGGAARYLLDRQSPAELSRIIASSTEYNLSGDRCFNGLFVENLEFNGKEL
jgi:uncharacterized 2Fe-2S/4Fe-4S cluster protein (DUF4445 family)